MNHNIPSIETKESCMEAFKERIILRDHQVVGTPHWRTLDLDCIEISSRYMKLGGDKKVLSEMLRNEKTKLPETLEERVYILEKEVAKLQMQGLSTVKTSDLLDELASRRGVESIVGSGTHARYTLNKKYGESKVKPDVVLIIENLDDLDQ